MKAIININYTQSFKNTNLKGKSFKVVETVGNRTTLNINGRLTDFYNNEVTTLETKSIEVDCNIILIYQLAFLTPGNIPWWASLRKQSRQMPNKRINPCGRPQIAHRL